MTLRGHKSAELLLNKYYGDLRPIAIFVPVIVVPTEFFFGFNYRPKCHEFPFFLFAATNFANFTNFRFSFLLPRIERISRIAAFLLLSCDS